MFPRISRRIPAPLGSAGSLLAQDNFSISPYLPGPRTLAIFLFAALCAFSTLAQKNPPRGQGPASSLPSSSTLRVTVRDHMGGPLDVPAIVNLSSSSGRHDSQPTRDGSVASFQAVAPGEYDLEVHCLGYKTATDRISVSSMGTDFTVYVYLEPESGAPSDRPASGVAMTPKLRAEIDKGLDALRKKQFDAAKTHFTKASQLAPGLSDVFYLLGVSELGLEHRDLARQDFEKALSIDPSHEKALLALGELQLRAGETQSAIITLEKAYAANGADWRTHLLLAAAYSKANQFPQAEAHATRAVALAQDKGASASLLLGEAQYAQGKFTDATRTWEQLIARFPNDPLVPAARQRLAQASTKTIPPTEVSLALPSAQPALSLLPVTERPWAPLDIDEKEYPVAPHVSCDLDDVLSRATHRVHSQLQNFERFTATEHIEHQDVDRYGRPGPVRARDFSYVVFIHTFAGDSLYLEENRNGSTSADSFPTSLATTGLNSLGVSILQPAYRNSFNYQCQGLANIRGQDAWQVRFQEKDNATATIRTWQRNGTYYALPLKGRIWLSAATFDVLRVETDLTSPQRTLELNRDHLLVDYGPVTFSSTNSRLWLPWSAEMFIELHGKRYHHKHFLTDYMLFAVDSSNKIAKPADTHPTQDSP
ncbi:MAG: tetratricopeptide repeat protein [Candidatus Acidiferrum sp.]